LLLTEEGIINMVRCQLQAAVAKWGSMLENNLGEAFDSVETSAKQAAGGAKTPWLHVDKSGQVSYEGRSHFPATPFDSDMVSLTLYA
jgi:hypothetical protein